MSQNDLKPAKQNETLQNSDYFCRIVSNETAFASENLDALLMSRSDTVKSNESAA